ncbi:MAG: hypothetical protein IPK59_04075 [Rhodospirillaceae bacterium]|nr:hypothetical protein [Rhodospirillaceae bacterium]
MNGHGGSFIMQADGTALQVEGQNMTDAERATARAKADDIISEAARKQTEEEAAAAAPKTEPAGDGSNPSEGGTPGRRRQS